MYAGTRNKKKANNKKTQPYNAHTCNRLGTSINQETLIDQ